MNSECNDQFLTAAELASRWRVHVNSDARWRMEGKPPDYHMINGKILYKLADIEALELAKRKSQTT